MGNTELRRELQTGKARAGGYPQMVQNNVSRRNAHTGHRAADLGPSTCCRAVRLGDERPVTSACAGKGSEEDFFHASVEFS